MLSNRKKVIGVCITKVNDISRSDYLNRLHYIAKKAGCKLIVFNSFVDFFNNDSFDEGAKSVYDLINYDLIDVLILHNASFHNKSILDGIINTANIYNVPVVIVGGEHEGCHSILSDYDEAYKALLCHVMREHGIKDTFFIAGNRNNDIESERRINCYKEALAECGIPFEEDRVAYGEYWDRPTQEIVHRLAGDGKTPPKAIFCANDYMAFATCEELKKCGYNVPDDVVVTGFDGVPAAEHFVPQMTTCSENLEALAMLSVEAALNAVQDNSEFRKYYNRFIPVVSESCGCKRLANENFRDAAASLYQVIDDMELHEDFIYAHIDRMLEITDMNTLYSTISKAILQNSYVCFNSDFVSSVMDISSARVGGIFSDQMVTISSEYTYEETNKVGRIELSDVVPYISKWEENDTMCILTSIHVGSQVCGYYAVNTDSLMYSKLRIKRVIKAINIALNVAINYFKQAKMRIRIENAALFNNVSGLPSMRGAIKWFDDFSAREENHSKTLSVSVYGLPKYTYIYENFGIEAAEEAVKFVAESLKVANPNDCFVAHISEGDFVVINYYSDPESISATINKATSVFFSVVEGYNSNNGKPYFTEVNCGCTVVDANWDGSLESYIKFANAEMYMNRLQTGSITETVKDQKTPSDHYKVFDLLVSKNMFHYHFQPIVSAKSGEIYAYEALMRTDQKVGLNPLQVLDIAREYHRLYDIERATLFNIMNRYSQEREKFGDAKVFINTIPGHFLNDTDIDILSAEHGEYMDKFVFELTEQGTVSDDELDAIKRLSGTSDASCIAIDDYGTGHSNIVNLMRYAPHVIKIDRFLITDIEKNQNKQMFVRSIIDFARINKIKVLAEGVETSNELSMVIDLGVDLIQGYYTARPAPEPIFAIPDDIKNEIISANPLYDRTANDK